VRSLDLDVTPRPSQWLAWWLQRLGELVPRPLVRLLNGPERRLVVDLSAAPARLVRLANGREVEQLVLGDGEPAAAVRRAAARLGRASAVRLRLAPGRVLHRRIELPQAVEEDVEAALGFELDRLTPFQRDDVHLAFDVVGRDREAGRLTLDLRVTPRSEVEAALARLRGWGIAADRVEVVADEAPTAVIPIDVARRRPRLGRWHAWLNWLLVLALGLLVADWQYREYTARLERLTALQREQAELQPMAEEALALKAAIDAEEARRDSLLRRRQATPLALALLDEISARLPDHTWLERASMDDGRVEIVGYSPAVAELVAAFTASPLFEGVTYESPVVRDSQQALDQFHLGLTIAQPAPAGGVGS
jgi:general secretion pathway protein L